MLLDLAGYRPVTFTKLFIALLSKTSGTKLLNVPKQRPHPSPRQPSGRVRPIEGTMRTKTNPAENSRERTFPPPDHSRPACVFMVQQKREQSQLVGRQGDVNVELHAPIVCSFSNVFGEHFSSLFEGLCNTYFTFLFSSKTVADKQFLQNT